MPLSTPLSGTPRPLLLVDVDGPLNPWSKITKKGHQAGEAYTKHLLRPRGFETRKDPLPVLLSSEHGPALNGLIRDHVDMVWATTWADDANTLISPLLGIPNDLPVLTWPTGTAETQRRQGRNGSWKTHHIAAWLAQHAPDRPWVWVDDEINRYDRTWFKQWYLTSRPVPHLLMRIEAGRGLVADDFDTITHWATTA
jgi:hypothetical protein